MKNHLFVSILLLGVSCVVLQAQVPNDEWSVFEPGTGHIKSVEVPHMAVPAAVVGPDDREEETGRAPEWERAVVVLEMDGRGLCSGSMVAPNIVLTAAHCLHFEGKYMQTVNVYAVGMPPSGNAQPQPPTTPPSVPKEPQKDPREVVKNIILNKNKQAKNKSFGPIVDEIIKHRTAAAVAQNNVTAGEFKQAGYPASSSKQIWVPSQWIEFTKHKRGGGVDIEKEETYDYGIVVLEKPLGDQTGWLRLSVPSDSELKGAEIVVVGRGGDKPKRSLWRAQGRIGQVHKRYFYHDADMMAGNSGGPIMRVNDRSRIIALNNFQHGPDRARGGYPNGGLRITARIVSVVQKASN